MTFTVDSHQNDKHYSETLSLDRIEIIHIEHKITRFISKVSLCPLSGHPGRSESYLEAIRKNIEWLKKHNKDSNKDGKYLFDFTLSDKLFPQNCMFRTFQ